MENVETTLSSGMNPGKILLIFFIVIFIFIGVLFFFFYSSSPKDSGISCTYDSDCDDGNLCTTDSCSLKTGICYNVDKKCAIGQRCNYSTGVCAGINFSENLIHEENIQLEISESENFSNFEEKEQNLDQNSNIPFTIPPPPPLPN